MLQILRGHRRRHRFATFAVICLSLLLLSARATAGDEVADKLLAERIARTKSLRTLNASITVSWQTPTQSLKKNIGTIKLMKPNYALVQLTGDYPLVTLASDGHSRYMLPDVTKYTLAVADSQGKNIDTPWWALPVRFFFTQNINPFGSDSPPWTSSKYVGRETLDGHTYDVIEIMGDKPMAYVARYYFDEHKLFRRSIVRFGEGPSAAVFTAELRNVRTRVNLTRQSFRFTPPATARLDTGAESRMIALGDAGPDFSLPTPEGKTLNLENFRKGKRAVLINFWFVACLPCRAEFQLFQKLHNELKNDGFDIVAINALDDANNVKRFLREQAITFPVVLAKDVTPGVIGNYRIETYPSTYLLNSEGKVVYRSVGVDEPGLMSALKDIGLQKPVR
jgi:peroxiredoxin/outer membrane lipoprotein-sorting protein